MFLIGLGLMHEQVHKTIYSDYGIDSKIYFFKDFPNPITMPEESCPNNECKLLVFHTSLESWRFEPEGSGTLVAYDFEFEPKFWIPPLIGSYMLQRKLRDDSVRAINRIEAIAQERQQ